MKNSTEEKKQKFVKVIVGAFIMNEKNELFLLKAKQWGNKYMCPGGHLELNESLQDAIKREVKEETNLELINLEFISVKEGINLGEKYRRDESHHVYINFKAETLDTKNIKLNAEATAYKWLSIEEWKKKDNLGPNMLEILNELSKDNIEERYKRALADYQNLLKQSAKEKLAFAQFANESLLHKLIPVYDNLKTSMKHLDEVTKKNSWVTGVGYILKQFGDALREVGVEEIETEGKIFDHNNMEAMSGQGNKVAKELRPGYKLYGKVIIPAKVELE